MKKNNWVRSNKNKILKRELTTLFCYQYNEYSWFKFNPNFQDETDEFERQEYKDEICSLIKHINMLTNKTNIYSRINNELMKDKPFKLQNNYNSCCRKFVNITSNYK